MNRWLACVALVASPVWSGATEPPLSVDATVIQAEALRIEVIERISRSTVAIFEKTGTNGGSGVIISDDGLVVTNFHVTAPCGPMMLVGTNDGLVHEAVLLGLDPTGDIALVRLLGDGPFPAAELGNSDRVRVGDPAYVVGNPFLLAEDFTPSVTAGIISGVDRYQPPAGGVLEYADCLQTDAAINPGNSGGPLFDGHGRLIGINGRGSFEKRGRVNVGVGYAISINQVKRFVSPLETGLIVDHASLGATVITRSGPQAIVDAIETGSDAYRRGLRPGDEVVSLGGRDTPTANALLNAVGVLPAGWRTRLEFRRDGRLVARDVRMESLHAPGELQEAVADATPPDVKKQATPDDLPYEAREGYANYAVTRKVTERLLRRGAIAAGAVEPLEVTYDDTLSGEPVTIRINNERAEWLAASGEYHAEVDRDLTTQAAPPTAPALLGGLWIWSRLATAETGQLDRIEAIGKLPWEVDSEPHEVLVATHRGLRVEVFFDPQTHQPVGFEASRDAAEDRARVAWTDLSSGPLPRAMTISLGDLPIALLSNSDAEQEGRP